MKRASDQLLEEATYPSLAVFLPSGGRLEVGQDLSVGTFARIRKGNQTVTVDGAYRDFAAVLKKMETRAKDFLNRAYEHPKVNE